MKPVLLTVFYNTPHEYQQQLAKDCERLQLDWHGIDVTGQKRGYADALNELIHIYYDDYDLFFISNPDIILTGISQNTFLEPFQKFDIAGYAMKQNGVTYYGGEIDRLRMSGGLSTEKHHERFKKSDFVSGSLMGIKKEVLEKIGYLNESFFMYYEDVEFCFRAARSGFKVGIDTEQWYDHLETSQTNPEKKALLARNRMKFLWEQGTITQKMYELLRLPKTLLEDGKYLI